MPTSDTPAADLWPQVSAVLLRSFGWVALAAILCGTVAFLLSRRNPSLVDRVRVLLFGPGTEREPAARRFLRIAFGLLWIADGLLQAQPRMASAFAAQYLSAATGPRWFAAAEAVLARAWLRHPVASDVATVWVQVGLGLLLLLGGRGLVAKLASFASIAWAVVVWFFGESLGGLLMAGAGWLTGAPGAALVYALAAIVLLLRTEWWRDGRAALVTRRLGAGWLAVAAVLTALPSERLWDPPELARPFAEGVNTNPSAALRTPIRHLESLAISSPHVLNGVVVGVAALLALALWTTGRSLVIGLAIVWCLATWWLAQDFGVLGGTATDPQTALPLALLLATALPAWQPREVPQPASAAAETTDSSPRRVPAWLVATASSAAVVALALAVVVPAVLAARLPAPADASAIAANSNGGMVRLPGQPLPRFALRDQRGRLVTTSGLHGKVVVLTFLDPVCTSDCPVIGAQLGMADRRLGPLAKNAEFVALDTNPVFHRRADVAAFTASHYLAGLPNWHFLWGDPARIQPLLADFGVSVDVPAVGMIEHSEALYFADPDGGLASYLDDGAAAELTSTYAQQVRSEIQALLR